MAKKRSRIAIALSGGGFRATLFHLGALIRLNETGILGKASAISAVSGGAVLTGILATKWHNLIFQNNIAINFDEQITQPIINFCSHTIDIKAALLGLIVPRSPLIYYYRANLYGQATLQDLPDTPQFIFNATHLETGKSLRFSKEKLHTYQLGYVPRPSNTIAEIVAASTACPPYLPPIVLDMDPNQFMPYPQDYNSTLYHRHDLKAKLHLADGGIYDNLGLHAIRHYPIQLASDASSPLTPIANNWHQRFSKPLIYRAIRPLESALTRAGDITRHEFVNRIKRREIQGCLWTIKTPTQRFEVERLIRNKPHWEDYFSGIGTRLKKFPTEIITGLIDWGYHQCDLSLRANYDSNIPAASNLPMGSIDQFDRDPPQ